MNLIPPSPQDEGIEAQILACQTALKKNDLAGAEKFVQPVVLHYPDLSAALNLVGNIRIRRNGASDALLWFKSAVMASSPPSTITLLNLAMALELSGDTQQAIQVHNDLLAIDTNHMPSQQNLARLQFLGGHFRECLDILTSLELSKFDQFFMRGICKLRLGHADAAIADLKSAISSRGDFYPEAAEGLAEALHNTNQFRKLTSLFSPIEPRKDLTAKTRHYLALAYLALEQRKHAEQQFLLACEDRSSPQTPSHRQLSTLYFEAHRFEHAETFLLAILETLPNDFLALEMYGECLLKRNQFTAAIAFAEDSLGKDPPSPAHWNMFCILIKSAHDKDKALYWFEKAVEKYPEQPVLFFNYGHLLNEMSRAEEAMPLLSKGALLDPEYAKIINALCVSHCMRYEHDRALVLVNRALLIAPKMAPAWLNRGILHRTAGELGKAADAMKKALEYDPHDVNANSSYAYCLMMTGELEAGFHQYDKRWMKPDFPSPKRPFPQPVWTGESIENGKLLLYMEQGMGDELMFSWYLPYVQKNVKNIIIECDERLIPLFERSFPSIEFVPRDLKNPHPDTLAAEVLFKAPIGHVMKFYWYETREHINTVSPVAQKRIARTDGYLTTDSSRSAHWRKYLDTFPKNRLKVGICWRSAVRTRPRNDQYLEPEEIATPFDERFAIFNLQYDYTDEETSVIETHLNEKGALFATPPDIDLRDDLDDLTALIKELDIVVTPLISTAFMAGAVGTPVFVFRCNEQGKIWQNLGTDFVPWFPSMRIFFRHPTVPWKATIAEMGKALSDVAELPDWSFDASC